MHVKVAKQRIVFFRHACDSTQWNAQRQRLRLHGLSEERWAPDDHSLAHQATPHAQ
jgi:hypothetical protein